MSKKTALVLLHEGVEEMEFVAPVDILRRGDIEVTVAAVGDLLTVTGRCGLRIKADVLLSDALDSPQAVWDLLVIPGGPGVIALRRNPLALEAVKRHTGRLIGAICAAPLVLLDAGLLVADGSAAPYTAHPATIAELPAADATQAVVTATVTLPAVKEAQQSAPEHVQPHPAGSKNQSAPKNTQQPALVQPLPTHLITSRGAGTATVFSLTLLEELVGGEAGRKLAAEVAESICLGLGQ